MKMPASRRRSNEEWLRALRSSGATQEEALQDLRDYLLRAVLVYLSRDRSDLARFHPDELRQLAEDWAQEALLTIVDKLDTFRGQSKFTTWAYRVVINLAADELRHRRWKALSLEALAEEEEMPLLSMIEDTQAEDPEKAAERQEIWATIQRIIDEELTDRQRTALTNLLLRGMPMQEVAERLGTNKNNVYKIMHDARKKLKKRLTEYGLSEEYILATFSQTT
jgi:RNA polymerase sigma-70 factor (ECF subfamily)